MRISVQRQVEGSVIARAEALLAQIEKGVPNVPSKPSLTVPPSSGLSPPLLSPSSSQSSVSPRELQEKAQELVRDLTVQIQSTLDASKLEPLLLLCDRLNNAISSLSSSKPMVHKLGIRTEGLGAFSPNGNILHASPISMAEEDDELPTPRVDKGKGRAEPEPEEPEKILSPSFMISESEDEDESYESAEGIAVTSPTDRYLSRHAWQAIGLLICFVGPRAGWKKKVKYSEKAQSCWDRKKWKEITLVRIFVER